MPYQALRNGKRVRCVGRIGVCVVDAPWRGRYTERRPFLHHEITREEAITPQHAAGEPASVFSVLRQVRVHEKLKEHQSLATNVLRSFRHPRLSFWKRLLRHQQLGQKYFCCFCRTRFAILLLQPCRIGWQCVVEYPQRRHDFRAETKVWIKQ